MKKIILLVIFMSIGLLAYGQSARVFNEVKTQCDQINRRDRGLGNYIWAIIQYYNPQMVTNLVTREPNSNGRRIGLCQIHESIVQLFSRSYDPNSVFGSIMIARDYLQQATSRGRTFTHALFFLLFGIDSFDNMDAVYDHWFENELPRIRELANEFTGWGF
jgi:hypothetical protein